MQNKHVLGSSVFASLKAQNKILARPMSFLL